MNDEQIKNLNKKIQKCVKQIEGIINNTNTSDLTELNDSVIKVYGIYQRFPNSEDLAGYYMSILAVLAISQEDLETLQDSVSKASRIYQRFPNSEVFAGCYMSILDILTMSQEDLETLQDCVFEANSICQSFPNSEYLASYYIYFLSLLAKKQKSIEESKVTIMLAMELYNRFPNLKKFKWIFVFFISNYINFFLLNSHNEEKKKSLVNLEVLFDCMYNASAELIKDIIDRMFYPDKLNR